MMNKLKLYLLLFIAALFACSCEDNSGEFVNQLFTNAEKNAAIKSCLNASADSAVNHLFVYDGFYQNRNYLIDFAPLSYIFDTLSKHQQGNLADSLILRTNRMAEGCGVIASTSLDSAIKQLNIKDFDELIKGESGIITDYLKAQKSNFIKSSMQSQVGIRMQLLNVNSTWKEIVNTYRQYDDNPINVDIQGYIIDKMMNNIFEEMRLEEYNVRTDTTHQNEDSRLFRY